MDGLRPGANLMVANLAAMLSLEQKGRLNLALWVLVKQYFGQGWFSTIGTL